MSESTVFEKIKTNSKGCNFWFSVRKKSLKSQGCCCWFSAAPLVKSRRRNILWRQAASTPLHRWCVDVGAQIFTVLAFELLHSADDDLTSYLEIATLFVLIFTVGALLGLISHCSHKSATHSMEFVLAYVSKWLPFAPKHPWSIYSVKRNNPLWNILMRVQPGSKNYQQMH